jgi:ubiquinone/menaquinone biosynthesis C-methylase UbiE
MALRLGVSAWDKRNSKTMTAQHNVLKNYHVCPWWMAYTFDNPLRRLFHKPGKMLAPYVQKGMTVMDVGCGMGYFSIAMAKMVGDNGRVIAVDLQQKMLNITLKRARRAGVARRIQPHLCEPGDIGLNGRVDFVLTFWMIHEVQNRKEFFSQLNSILVPNGKLLIAEPKMHVTTARFQEILDTAQTVDLMLCGQPSIKFSHSAVFEK